MENRDLFNEELNDLLVFDIDEFEEMDMNFFIDIDLLIFDFSELDFEFCDENDVEKEVDFEKWLIYKGV